MDTRSLSVEDVPEPTILNQRDAIVRITATAICGSDLHIYNGLIPTMKAGDVLGHEFMGEVVEVGSEVKNLRRGTGSWSRSPSPAAGAASVARVCSRSARTRIPTRGWPRS
jgi:D-arabinose 1-dehydrogenase-like Zn-dependent alcohol dehydrogenase